MKRKTTCNRDCPDACGLVATVEDGRILKLEGDLDHPVTRGFLCSRTNRFLERQYDPERITEPLVRRGDDFEPISWNDVLDRIAERMLRIKNESGSAAILHFRSAGAMGMVKSVTDYFFERFGPVTVKVGDICSGAGEFAQETDFGVSDSNDIFDLLNARTIVMWGKNPYVSYLHLLPLLKEAKANGARLVQIDPVHHRGADLADTYLQPRPGGDIALALGIARVLFERGRTDPQAPSYCDHYEEFRRLAFSNDLEACARWADVTTEEIEKVAELYADGPSNIVVGWGMQRRARGAATIRVIDALAAISGNLGVPGGGVSFYIRRRGAFDLSFVRGREIAPRTIPEALLGKGILEASDPEIRMVWVTSANPVAMLPESRTIEKALRSRELTVVVDSFLTDTARCAHLILPTTTMLEDDDLVGAYGHHWLADMRPVVPPPDGVKTDLDIVRELAPRVGLDSDLTDDAGTWKRRILSGIESKGVSLEALREGAVRNPLAPEILFADRRFPTPNGRAQLIRDAEPRPELPPDDRPLLLAALSTKDAQASQWPSRAQQGPATVTVHPDAAEGFVDGDLALVESEVGSLTVKLKLDPRQRRDMLLMDKGGWLQSGRCANALIRARETDHGGCAVYYDTPVRLLPTDSH